MLFTGNSQPVRCGIFAASSVNHTRQETGAAYYGVMEMSGNLYEGAVNIGNVAGRSFTGLHGYGELDASGYGNVSYWPGINGNSTVSTANTTYGGTTGITGPAGMYSRGGVLIRESSDDRGRPYTAAVMPSSTKSISYSNLHTPLCSIH